MCLSVPAKLMAVQGSDPGFRSGKVSFGGVLKEVCLAFVPEAQIGDYVLVHAGFALSVIHEQEAEFVFQYLNQAEPELGNAQDEMIDGA